MKKTTIVALFLLLLSASTVMLSVSAAVALPQTAACPNGQQGSPPQCPYPGTHPEVQCICDGPAGPCHWVWHCVKN